MAMNKVGLVSEDNEILASFRKYGLYDREILSCKIIERGDNPKIEYIRMVCGIGDSIVQETMSLSELKKEYDSHASSRYVAKVMADYMIKENAAPFLTSNFK